MKAYVPHSLGEALELRAEHPEAVPVAGGTDLMVALNAGRLRPPALLDLSRVAELDTWRRVEDTVFVGGGMTFARIARELVAFSPLAAAAQAVGSPQIRNRATLGGNVVTASPAGDGIAVLAAYDADIVLGRVGMSRRVPWHAFFTGPKRTVLEPDELVLGVEWRVARGPGAFAKVGPRNAMVIAVASACLQLDGTQLRLAFGSVGPTVLRAHAAETFAAELADWEEAARSLVEFGQLAAAEAQPIDDLRGTAAYRRHVVAALARRTLTRALDERRGDRC